MTISPITYVLRSDTRTLPNLRRTKHIARRDMLRGAGVAAFAAGAAAFPTTAPSYVRGAGEEEAVRLWREFMAAENAFGETHDIVGLDDDDPRMLAAEDVSANARLEIARLAVTGPLAVAVKLAVIATGESEDYMRKRLPAARMDWDLVNNYMLVSIYQHAVAQCGYDPIVHFGKDYEERSARLGAREVA